VRVTPAGRVRVHEREVELRHELLLWIDTPPGRDEAE
jgi:hypothetical protein